MFSHVHVVLPIAIPLNRVARRCFSTSRHHIMAQPQTSQCTTLQPLCLIVPPPPPSPLSFFSAPYSIVPDAPIHNGCAGVPASVVTQLTTSACVATAPATPGTHARIVLIFPTPHATLCCVIFLRSLLVPLLTSTIQFVSLQILERPLYSSQAVEELFYKLSTQL